MAGRNHYLYTLTKFVHILNSINPPMSIRSGPDPTLCQPDIPRVHATKTAPDHQRLIGLLAGRGIGPTDDPSLRHLPAILSSTRSDLPILWFAECGAPGHEWPRPHRHLHHQPPGVEARAGRPLRRGHRRARRSARPAPAQQRRGISARSGANRHAGACHFRAARDVWLPLFKKAE